MKYSVFYVQVKANAQRICDELSREEATFVTTLSRGQKILDELLVKAKSSSSSSGNGAGAVLSGGDAFLLYDTYGFPLELTQELAEAQGVKVRGG